MIRASAVLTMILAASGSAQERVRPYPITESAAFARAIEAGTRTTAGRPGENYTTNRARYRIEAALDPEKAELRGRIHMHYFNRSPDSLRQLRVHLRQNLHREGNIRNVRVSITGGMRIEDVTLEGEPLEDDRYSVRGTVMRVRLPEPLHPGGHLTLGMDFRFLAPPSSGAPRMGHEDRHVFYLGYWYPQFAVYDDVRGWVSDPYMGSAEFYMGYADYELALTVPHGWIVRATGELQNPRDVLPRRVRERLEQARRGREVVHVVGKGELGRPGAATRSSASGTLTWRFLAENVRDVAFCVSDRCLWDASHAVVERAGNDGGEARKAMIHAFYEEDAPGWKRAAEYSRHTIEYMSRTLYPYPWPHMTACEGIVGGGMEYPMMTCVGPSRRPRAVERVIAHELIHMWFPMLVGTDEKSWRWMDEGLTSFFTSLVSNDFWEGSDEVEGFAVGYRNAAKRIREVPAMRHTDALSVSERGPHGFASYSKTAAVMHQLMHMLGRETFMGVLRSYVEAWAWKHPYPYDLFNAFDAGTGLDLDWYFRTWFYETWTLDQAVAGVRSKDGTVEVTVVDHGPATAPSIVRATYPDGRRVEKLVPVATWIGGARSVTLEFEPGMTRVAVDPDSRTLDVNPDNNVWTPGEQR